MDLVPHHVVPSAIVLWLFINNNIGGSITLLVPVVESQLTLQYSLLLLFPGCYLMASFMFSMTLLTLGCRTVVRRKRKGENEKLMQVPDSEYTGYSGELPGQRKGYGSVSINSPS